MCTHQSKHLRCNGDCSCETNPPCVWGLRILSTTKDSYKLYALLDSLQLCVESCTTAVVIPIRFFGICSSPLTAGHRSLTTTQSGPRYRSNFRKVHKFVTTSRTKFNDFGSTSLQILCFHVFTQYLASISYFLSGF